MVYLEYLVTYCAWSHCLQSEMRYTSVAVPPTPIRVPSHRPVAPSITLSGLLGNYKGDNDMILRAVHRSPSIYLTAEENPENPQLGDSR